MTKITRISFRLDDITPGMEMTRFNRARAIFDRFEIKPLLGVVPFNQDKKLELEAKDDHFWDLIRELSQDGWIISQHGYIHIYDSDDGGILKLRPKSEFAGHSLEKQREKLGLGLEILKSEGIVPKVFMAPGHTFDMNTIRALKELGFEYITDGLSDEPYFLGGLMLIPSKNSRPKKRSAVDTVCLHTNEMSEEDFSEMEEFIGNHRELIVDFADLMKTENVAEYGLFIQCQIIKNRLMKKIRAFVARNKLLHGILGLRSK